MAAVPSSSLLRSLPSGAMHWNRSIVCPRVRCFSWRALFRPNTEMPVSAATRSVRALSKQPTVSRKSLNWMPPGKDGKKLEWQPPRGASAIRKRLPQQSCSWRLTRPALSTVMRLISTTACTPRDKVAISWVCASNKDLSINHVSNLSGTADAALNITD